MLEPYAARYRQNLVDSVIPFWLNHSLDREHGGYFSCLDRMGAVYDTRKYVWLQGRAIWMFSRLYNELESRREFLDAASLGVHFLRRHARDANGRLYFSLTREGAPFFFQRKPYAAVFYQMGLFEYARATGDADCLAESVEVFWKITDWIRKPELLDRPIFPSHVPVSNLANLLVVGMMALDLAKRFDDPRYDAIVRETIAGVQRHYDRERQIFVENVALDGRDLSEWPEGRLFNPGHSIETARQAADCTALAAWLEASAPMLDGLIVSLEMLGYGGLIASRIGDDPAAVILSRLALLRTIRQRHPQLPIYALSAITRVSNANDAVEEPEYWAEYGEQLYLYSQLLDRQQQGQAVGGALADLEAALPIGHRRDFLAHRLRNHGVNIGALHMLADGCFDLLVLCSDDTSPHGLPARERRWLTEWTALLGLAGGSEQPLLMYPGADEVACALVTRLLNQHANRVPTVAVQYAPPEAAANVAAYEDQPVEQTVERQIMAIGGARWEAASGLPPDIWIGVNAPFARRSEWQLAYAEAEQIERLPALAALLDEARQRQAAGQVVAIATESLSLIPRRG